MERDEAKKIFTKLASNYPNWKVDKTIATNWVDELESEDAENAWANTKEYIRKEKFAPTLSDIVKPNVKLEAEKEISRTRELLREQDELKSSIPTAPPWVREGVSREVWTARVVAERKAK